MPFCFLSSANLLTRSLWYQLLILTIAHLLAQSDAPLHGGVPWRFGTRLGYRTARAHKPSLGAPAEARGGPR